MMRRAVLVFVVSVMFISVLAEAKDAGVRFSADYVVEVSGQEVPVCTSSVSPDARQAPLNLNEFHSFAGFECSGPVVGADKGLEPEWVESLTQRGHTLDAKIRGSKKENTLNHIGMPVGGIGCGTVYLGGDGRLYVWDIFNRFHEGVVADRNDDGELTRDEYLSMHGANFGNMDENGDGVLSAAEL